MLTCIKESFKLTNKFIILATPLILFSLLSSLYIIFSMNGNLLGLIFAFILFIMMLGAFLSGWFFMIKQAIVASEEYEDPNFLIKEFPAGVGEYFLNSLGMIINVFIVIALFLFLSYLVGMKFIGQIGISAVAFSKAVTSPEALRTFLLSLSDEQLFRLNAWNLLLLGSMIITYFVIFLYPPTMFYKEKNPFKAFLVTLKNLLSKNFFKNILLYLILFISYFLISIITTIFGSNIFAHFVLTLVNFYYMIYAAVLIFYYYSKNYVN